jgi:hypothetical protein
MERQTSELGKGSVDSQRLAALLDKLVAIRLDLEPICGTSNMRAQVVDTPAAIAEVCDILRAAIADLLSVMGALEGRPFAPDGDGNSRPPEGSK